MKTHFYLVILLFNLGLYAQSPPPNFTNCGTPTQGNLVINGGFEENNNNIPNSLSQLILACNWIDNVSDGSPDYFHTDSPLNDGDGFSIPDNTFGYQNVNPDFGGHAYAGFGVSPALTEMIATQLTTPLQPNRNYILSFDVSMADYTEEIPEATSNPIKLQAFLSTEFISNSNSGELNTSNGILEQYDTFSSNTTGWDRISLGFSTDSNAGQQYLYIGGISNIVFQDPNATGGIPTYYYIDNVSLVQGNIECIDESIGITCYNSENSNTSTVCGNFTTAYPEDYQLTITGYTGIFQNQFTLNHEDFTIPEEDIQINTDGTITGTYCIEFTNQGNLDYNFTVTLSSNSGICSTSTSSSLFNLDLCTQEPDPCEAASIEIVSNIPNCADLNAFGSFPITASINLPEGYTQQDAGADIGADNITLDIIDVSNPNTPFMTLYSSTDLNNGSFGTNVMELTFLVSNAIITSMSETTSYEFEFNANLNGECPIIDTVGEFSLVGCTETSVDLVPIDVNCSELGDSFTLNLCGSFSTSLNDNAVLHENGLVLEAIHSSGNSQIINVPLSIPFASNEFCFTLTEADLPYGLTGNYNFRVIGTFSDDNSQGFTETDLESGIDFNPCDNSDPCAVVSINITSEIPDCNIFDNSSSFDICGTFSTSANATGYNLTYSINSPNNFPNISNYTITPTNVMNSNGIISGNFCITLYQSSFNPEIDQVQFQITSKINGIKCSDTIGYFLLPYEECEDCPPIYDVYILDGSLLQWLSDVESNQYIFQFAENKYCNNEEPTVIYESNLSTNEFDLRPYSHKFKGQCMRYRIISECGSETPWCNVYYDGSEWSFLEGNCLDSGRIMAQQQEVKLYPNPAKHKFEISSKYNNLSSIQLYDVYGNLVKIHDNIDTQKHSIDVNDLREGYYIAYITLRDGTTINKKLVIE